ncbi:hypothetical protein Btru_010416 [Bulinus truncatus]|nr:hypothetical protein Btru_010416 [Bulinus truncatus]
MAATFNSLCGRLGWRHFLLLVVCVLLILFYGQLTSWTTTAKVTLSRPTCRNVLDTMVVGAWRSRSHGEEEVHQIEQLLHSVRQQLNLPYSLERGDKLCGNVTFDELEGRMYELQWFRALCDPSGDTPCCFNNHCVNKDAEQCKCDLCYDLRHPIHAELATWIPSDSKCQMKSLTPVWEVCHLLNNMTIYIIGDSLLRHVYVSLLTLIRSDKYYGPLLQYTSPGIIQMCDRDFVYLHMCMNHIDRDTWECDRSVKLKFFEYVRASQSNLALSAILELAGKPNSLVVLGIGIHDNFNSASIVKDLIQPILNIVSRSKWPKIVWSSTHSPGVMKSAHITNQSTESILQYNAIIKTALQGSEIPVFDTFRLTNGTMSFDGVHYGRGVNDVKTQILLNYILELRELKHIDSLI